MAQTLYVYQGRQHIGILHDEHPLRFSYQPQWLQTGNAQPIAPAFPLQEGDFSGPPVTAFFENLLPEGPVRRLLQASRHTSTVFGLLRSVAGDTAGSLTLLPPGETPAPPAYQRTTWQHISQQLRQGTAPALGAPSQPDRRISLAGAQTKLLLMIFPDGQPAFPLGAAPSSHILKPDIQGLPGVWASALNETLVMNLAAVLGLGTAQAQYQPDTQACLIQRYDRHAEPNGSLTRLHQLDLCQLAGIPSGTKYEADGGPSLADCRRLLQDIGIPAKDLKRLVQWIIFNLFVGNHDSHAKNLSVLATPHGWQLAPFYDLMCTTLYPGLARQFAFKIGNTNLPGQIGVTQLRQLSHALGLTPGYVLQLAKELYHALPSALDLVAHKLSDQTPTGTPNTLIQRLDQKIRQESRKYARRWEIEHH
ncbi:MULTISPECIES: type II toxin-antitoxin system HipA family toxin [unclassified Castellaniella]|jgi:serine/threonine-protein kinase HipA|uniref:type II toxin-antitoxin system HipA family toxin n=1 Tax=unclassified Castellaniella TaxID=2617606 RepID=UPI00331622D8